MKLRSTLLAVFCYLAAGTVLSFGGWIVVLAARAEGTPEQTRGLNTCVWFLFLFILFPAAGLLIRYGKRLGTKTAADAMLSDPRPPILYLRSFRDDAKIILGVLNFGTRTEEEALVAAFDSFGPVIAIGDPGESIPETGAARLYVAHDEWQRVAMELLDNARLVILYVGWTEGVLWEMQRAKAHLAPEKLLLILPGDLTNSLYERFRGRAEAAMGISFPTARENSRFVRFSAAWEPVFMRAQPPQKSFGRRVRPATFEEISNDLFNTLAVS